jgi:hypothetical protein
MVWVANKVGGTTASMSHIRHRCLPYTAQCARDVRATSRMPLPAYGEVAQGDHGQPAPQDAPHPREVEESGLLLSACKSVFRSTSHEMRYDDAISG